MATKRPAVKKATQTTTYGFEYTRPKDAYFDYVPSVKLLPSHLNEPNTGFSMTVVDVLNCYCLANRVVVDEIDEKVKAWFVKEAAAKGWEKFEWWEPGHLNSVGFHPKPRNQQPRR